MEVTVALAEYGSCSCSDRYSATQPCTSAWVPQSSGALHRTPAATTHHSITAYEKRSRALQGRRRQAAGVEPSPNRRLRSLYDRAELIPLMHNTIRIACRIKPHIDSAAPGLMSNVLATLTA